MSRMSIIIDLWDFLKTRKRYWLTPIIVNLVFISLLIIFAQSTSIAPFYLLDVLRVCRALKLADIKIDELIRSHRKTIALMVTKDARLIVRAPYFASEDLIHRLIRQKEPWIKSKQDFFKQRQVKALPSNFRSDEEFLKYIIQRVEYYAQISALKYKSVRINKAKTRWGSCGYKDTLNFSRRLMMVPARVIDYVIVHELMHIKQKNHSHQFWAEVAKMIPDYKLDEQWLKRNGHFLA